jgi:hypothetical protein
LLLAVVILLVAGYLGYTQLVPHKSTGNKNAQVEVVGSIAPNFDGTAMSALTDGSKVRDFSQNLDLTTGLGNQAVFGQ